MLCYGYLIQTICAAALIGVNCYHKHLDVDWASQEVRKVISDTYIYKLLLTKRQIMWSDVFLIVPASALAKISILEFCKRVFVTKTCKWMCNSVIFLCSAWAFSTVFVRKSELLPLVTDRYYRHKDSQLHHCQPRGMSKLFRSISTMIIRLSLSQLLESMSHWIFWSLPCRCHQFLISICQQQER